MKLKNMNKLAPFIVFSSIVVGITLFASPVIHAAVDTDGDGYPDYIEIQYNYDPYSPCGKEVYVQKVYAYGKGRLNDLIDESCRQAYMVRTVNAILGKNITTNAKNLDTLTKAFIYGKYTPAEIAAVIATNQPLVHPTIKRDAWSRSPQYVKALQNSKVQEIISSVQPTSATNETPLYFPLNPTPQTTYSSNYAYTVQTKPVDAVAMIQVTDYEKNPLTGIAVTISGEENGVTLTTREAITDLNGMAYIRGTVSDSYANATVTLTYPTFTTKTGSVRLYNKTTRTDKFELLYARPNDIASTKQSLFDNSLILTKPSYSVVEHGNSTEAEIIITDTVTQKSLNGYRVYVANQMFKDNLNKIVITNLAPGHYVAKIVKVNNALQTDQIVEYFTLSIRPGQTTHIAFDVDSNEKVKSW